MTRPSKRLSLRPSQLFKRSLWPTSKQLELPIVRPKEQDRNFHLGGRSFYFFDFDDNVAFLSTPSFIFHKETGEELILSSGEFAQVHMNIGKKGPYKDYDFNFDDYQGFLNSGYCSLSLLNNFFNKLKLLEIYDKTKIIIVSDHGNGFINSKNYNIEPTAASALLLVKDFNQPDEFKISMQFMSNMDTYGIALSGVSEGKNEQLDRIKTPKKNRSLIYIQEVSPDDSYNITEAYKVKDNLFNKNNWEKLNQDQIEQLSESQSGV